MRLLPVLQHLRRVAEDLEPGQRVGERRPMGQAARDARRQARVARGAAAASIICRSRSRSFRATGSMPKLTRSAWRVTSARPVAAAPSSAPSGSEQRADEHRVRQLGRRRRELRPVPIEPRQRLPDRVGRRLRAPASSARAAGRVRARESVASAQPDRRILKYSSSSRAGDAFRISAAMLGDRLEHQRVQVEAEPRGHDGRAQHAHRDPRRSARADRRSIGRRAARDRRARRRSR